MVLIETARMVLTVHLVLAISCHCWPLPDFRGILEHRVLVGAAPCLDTSVIFPTQGSMGGVDKNRGMIACSRDSFSLLFCVKFFVSLFFKKTTTKKLISPPLLKS